MYLNGTRSCVLTLCCFMSLSVLAKDVKTVNAQGLQKPLCFVENKGQVKGIDNNTRYDIQYKLSTPGMGLYVGSAQLHYQFKKTEGEDVADMKVTTYDMGVTLVGANTHAKVVATQEEEYHENYYFAQSGDNAVVAHAYDKVVYKDVYPGIDWVLYVKDGKVEYDFVVRPGGNAHDIQIRYDGATALRKTEDGGIYAETPLGSVKEKTPYSYESGTGKAIASAFVLHNNVVSFETGAYNGSLTIDPYLLWSTYFGGANEDVATSVKETTSGVTFVGGFTSSTGLNTIGSVYFSGPPAPAVFEAFLAKYNTVGGLLYTTYFGGASATTTKCTSIALDNTGGGNPNVYIAGFTNSNSIGAGAVTAYHALNDGFVAKLNNAGTVTWRTYFGGLKDDYINAIVCDASNNIYITGQTASSTTIASGGAYQVSLQGINDAFAAKINGATGALTWGTYYGGTAQEQGFGIALDASNNVYITGQTNSVISVATPLAYQTLLSGTNDAFVAEISSSGNALVWGTYYGGPDIPGFPGTEQGNGIIVNQTTGAIAVVGNTTSASGVASVNADQTSYGGVQDAFVAYFNAGGTLAWSTYYGGSSLDYGQGICFDNTNNLVIAGGSFSTNNISSPSASQGSNAGDYDAYIAKFNTMGQRLWGTYFGGLYYDFANAVTCDANNQVTIAGYTTSAPSSGIYGSGGLATAGAALTTFMGGTYDAFISQFKTDTFLQINQRYIDTLICAGGVLNVSFTVNHNFQLTNTFFAQLSDITGSFTSATTIGSLSSNTSGTITCAIPAGITLGTGYRVRVVALNPGYTSPDDYYDIHIVASIPPTTASGPSPLCVGGSMLLNDNAPYNVTAYSWSGPATSGFSGTGFTATTQNPTNNGLAGAGITMADSGVYYVTTSHNGCPDVTSSVNIVVNSIIPPTPTLSSSTPICDGTNFNLYANPDTTVSGLTYTWFGPAGYTSAAQNPVVTGVTTAYSGTFFLADNLNGCSSAFASINIVVNNTTPASVSISATPGYDPIGGGDTICFGTNVSFATTAVNPGVSPHYQWYSGPFTPIVGAMSDIFSSPSLIDGAQIYCVMSSSVLCPLPVNATSNVITMNVINNPPVVKIFASHSSVVPGSNVTLTSATYNGGIGPLYQWLDNGIAIAGATNSSYIMKNVRKADTITLQLTSTMLCATPDYGISNPIIVQTNEGVANMVSVLGNIELFPNPNNGSFTVIADCDGGNNSTVTIEVLNTLGQVIYSDGATVQNNALNKKMSLQNIPDGIYLLRLSNEAQGKTLRFTVNR